MYKNEKMLQMLPFPFAAVAKWELGLDQHKRKDFADCIAKRFPLMFPTDGLRLT